MIRSGNDGMVACFRVLLRKACRLLHEFLFDSLERFLRNASVSLKCLLVANLVFWTLGIIGLWADHLAKSGRSKWLLRNKLLPGLYICGSDRIQLIQLVAFNTLFVGCCICAPLCEVLWDWWWQQQESSPTIHRLLEQDEWDWKHELCYKLPIHACLAEVGFYVVHRILHSSRFLYKHIHCVHHRFRAPTAMCCVYAHPLEFVFGNLLPIAVGPILTNAHPYTSYLWWGLAMVGTCKGHSGYKVMGHVDDHEDHHLLCQFNYGGMGLLDRVVGSTPPQPTAFPFTSKATTLNRNDVVVDVTK